jgi:hypothetical protein
MKINVSKIGAAKSQLIEALRLFFEQRDPASIHTLVGASLQILHDHIDDVGIVWDENLFLHKDTIYIKDEYPKEWRVKVNEARNFFKHADRDLKDGKTTIEFETVATQFLIFEAIRCLKLVENDSFDFVFEFQVFWGWYGLKYPTHLKPECREWFKRLSSMNPDKLTEFNALLVLARRPCR